MPEFRDTQPTGEVNTSTDYRDPTDVEEVDDAIKHGVIDELTRKMSDWIRTKMWRRHVREAIARMFEYMNVKYNQIKDLVEKVLKRQTEVEKRQTEIEAEFRSVIANATKDSEVINARSSEYYGDFDVLSDRLSNIEQKLSDFIPIGFDIAISHNLGVPIKTVNVTTWQHGLGIDPLGTEPEGLFGGTSIEQIGATVTNTNANECTVSIPAKFKSELIKLERLDENKFYFINESDYRTIMFELYV